MTAAIHFEAKKHAYRQTQDGVVISFVLHPNDISAELAAAPLGTQYVVALAPYVEAPGSATASHERIEANSGQAPALPAAGQKQQSTTLSQKAGMLADDLQFQLWVSKQMMTRDVAYSPAPRTAKEYIYRRCGISSLKELNTDEGARDLYWEMWGQYREEMGMQAELRS